MTYRQPFKGDFPISQRFGETITDPDGHTGIDYACPAGTPILASADGAVMFAGWDNTGFGWCVIIQHSDGVATLYAHLSLIPKTIFSGAAVRQSDVIGYSGSTGNSTGPHLHFEARRKWNVYRKESFDPMSLPLMSFADASPESATTTLKEPDQLGELVEVVCPDGAKVFNPDWSMKYYGFSQGEQLHFTGKTAKRPGVPQYTYCEVYEEPRKFWVAVHDGTTQILDNRQ